MFLGARLSGLPFLDGIGQVQWTVVSNAHTQLWKHWIRFRHGWTTERDGAREIGRMIDKERRRIRKQAWLI